MLIACDGGTQLVMGGLTLEEVSGIPQWVVSLTLLAIALLVNIFDVGMYGKVEGVVTIIMMIIYFAMAILGAAGAGEAMGRCSGHPGKRRFPAGGRLERRVWLRRDSGLVLHRF